MSHDADPAVKRPSERLEKRLGLIVPSVNVVLEPDFYRTVPENVTVHSQRVWVQPHGWSEDDAVELANTSERLIAMNLEAAEAARYLATARVDTLVYGCTSGGFFLGAAEEDSMLAGMRRVTELPVVAASPAILAALRTIGAKRISVASPYPSAVNGRLKDYLSMSGFEVLVIEQDPRAASGSKAISAESPSEIADFGARICAPGSEAIVCPCTAWRAFEAVGQLETSLGIPAITANEAMIWLALSTLDIGASASASSALFDTFP
jgi:maleate cis-trans isomerase